ncbi:hypothetical protein BH11PLA2_BH11PLA2_41340 [soil metagenome]
MKLLAALTPRIQRLMPSAGRGMSVALLGVLAAVEFAGRHATSEFHDALAGVALLAVGLFVVAWHRNRPLGWLEHLHRAAARWFERLEQLKYDVGIDFRGTPPYPTRLPRAVPVTLAVIGLVTALAFVAWNYYPNGWRDLGVQTSYVLYVLVLMVLWLTLFACMLGGVFLPVAILDQRLRAASGDTSSGPPDAVVVAGYALIALLVACVTPPIFAVSICVLTAVLGLFAAVLLRRDDVEILWRHSSRGYRGIYAIPLRRLVGLTLFAGGLGLFGLIAWACGSRLTAAPSLDSNMPLTTFLGAVTAWLVPGVAAVLAFQWYEFRRTDPARRLPVPVHLAGDSLTSALTAMKGWSFRVFASPLPRVKSVVGLRLVSEAESEAREFDPQWPLKVSLADLNGTLVKERVTRRDELQVRRRFFRSLAMLIKEAKKAAPSRGGGYLLAPHYWFIGGLLWTDPERSPTEDSDALRPLGTPFRKAFEPRVRQYLHQVLRALQIDAIYLEDGVNHRKLEKVLRSAFELHDIHGGRRRAEDHHFQGLPKIRVVIHDYEPGNPFELENYPEPKFDDMTRSRILHVFKDRGENEELSDSPFDFSWEPAPMAMR